VHKPLVGKDQLTPEQVRIGPPTFGDNSVCVFEPDRSLRHAALGGYPASLSVQFTRHYERESSHETIIARADAWTE
jgi:hypothetical protein